MLTSNIKRQDLYTTEEASQKLNIHKNELSRYVREGKLSRVKNKMNKCYSYYLKTEIDDFDRERQEEFYIESGGMMSKTDLLNRQEALTELNKYIRVLNNGNVVLREEGEEAWEDPLEVYDVTNGGIVEVSIVHRDSDPDYDDSNPDYDNCPDKYCETLLIPEDIYILVRPFNDGTFASYPFIVDSKGSITFI